jgi:hypothetical protein
VTKVYLLIAVLRLCDKTADLCERSVKIHEREHDLETSAMCQIIATQMRVAAQNLRDRLKTVYPKGKDL